MARRPSFGDEPVSQLAAWSGRLALFALAVAALSIVIVRSGILEIVPALATFAAALIFAALAVLLSFLGFVAIWRQGLSGLGSALLGLILGLHAARLSGLSRLSRQQAAGDLRHHHRSGQSAALRRAGAPAAARQQRLSGRAPSRKRNAPPIPTSRRCKRACRPNSSTTSRSRWWPSANGTSSMPARRPPAAATPSSRRSPARRSWASATTW